MLRLILNYRKGGWDFKWYLKKINLEKAKDKCVHNRVKTNLANFVSLTVPIYFLWTCDLELVVSMKSIRTLCLPQGLLRSFCGWTPLVSELTAPHPWLDRDSSKPAKVFHSPLSDTHPCNILCNWLEMAGDRVLTKETEEEVGWGLLEHL